MLLYGLGRSISPYKPVLISKNCFPPFGWDLVWILGSQKPCLSVSTPSACYSSNNIKSFFMPPASMTYTKFILCCLKSQHVMILFKGSYPLRWPFYNVCWFISIDYTQSVKLLSISNKIFGHILLLVKEVLINSLLTVLLLSTPKKYSESRPRVSP